MLKLARRARGHFVTLIEIRVHLIRYKPGHISQPYHILQYTKQVFVSCGKQSLERGKKFSIR